MLYAYRLGTFRRHCIISHLLLFLILIDNVSEIDEPLVRLLACSCQLFHLLDLVMEHLMLCILYVTDILDEFVVISKHFLVLC